MILSIKPVTRRETDSDSIVVRVSECQSVRVSGVGERERERESLVLSELSSAVSGARRARRVSQ